MLSATSNFTAAARRVCRQRAHARSLLVRAFWAAVAVLGSCFIMALPSFADSLHCTFCVPQRSPSLPLQHVRVAVAVHARTAAAAIAPTQHVRVCTLVAVALSAPSSAFVASS